LLSSPISSAANEPTVDAKNTAGQNTNAHSTVTAIHIPDSHRYLRRQSPVVDVARVTREKMSGTVFVMTVACRNSEKNNSETWAATSEELSEAEKT
jgi:hypothetical protein